MKNLLASGFAVLVILGAAGPIAAQEAKTPGQLAGVSQDAAQDPRPAVTFDSAVGSVVRTDLASVDDRHSRTLNRLWIASMVAMAAASAMDAGTSWGKLESNSLLASPDGRFGVRGAGIKVGIAAGVIIPQILLRRHKDLRMAFSVGNFAQTAVFGGIAIHNLGIAAPK
ncbi:MAG TPA: hypothetical protein VH640_05550 [Bryobacteraceae bacterium]